MRIIPMRQPRKLLDGARYHVTARVNRKEMILDDSHIKELFLSVVKRAKRKYAFRIENFCIMGNHVHFILLPLQGECLSAIMRWILSVFAMTFNRIKGYTGHVWGGRFYSRIIASLRDFIEVFDYIDENPARACLPVKGRSWRYGGLGHHRHACHEILEDPPTWLLTLFPNHEPFLYQHQ
jgi:putative transposase